ncbi:amidohydrolase family protein [Lignipirellula cremea]|uniref:Amidohydrolase-related domain-containing protein n=1 Tax=Lignipirellula cremea TaxID=2528010 RepID=A0A518DSA1_9BACT|nr:amidohydrolase family protein [Lignipirellula cremea]QDU94715.1 hypothetical protein Pla8534_25210 [Lignipirellula cremea]
MSALASQTTFLFRLVVGGLLLSAGSFAWAGPEVPGAPQQRPIALVGGMIVPVDGPTIEKGTVLFEDGKITAVGKKVDLPDDVQVIDVTGKRVYPGLFESMSAMGLIEIDSIRASRDYAEVGELNPNVRAEKAVNPDSELIPVTRSNGVLLALTAPKTGLLAGRSAVLQLDGWSTEDLTLQANVGLHLNWPAMSPIFEWESEKSAKEQVEARDKMLRQLQLAFDEARAYQKLRAAEPTAPVDARLESLLPVLAGDIPVIVQAEEVRQIQAALAFVEREGLRMILYGGYDAERCARLLKERQIPVILGGVHRLPRRNDDDYDAPFTLPARLHAAGVKFCIAGSGRFGASTARNLPYHAATAVAYGLPADVALEAITLAPAEILGVADRVGSLTVGKDATLIITTGDPLETSTAVEAAYIQGRRVDLSNRQQRLWKKYEQKYRQQR